MSSEKAGAGRGGFVMDRPPRFIYILEWRVPKKTGRWRAYPWSPFFRDESDARDGARSIMKSMRRGSDRCVWHCRVVRLQVQCEPVEVQHVDPDSWDLTRCSDRVKQEARVLGYGINRGGSHA